MNAQQQAAMIAWQTWRNGQYTALCDEAERVANLQRHDALRAERNPIYAGATRTTEEWELAENQGRYNRIVAMDTALKGAIWGWGEPARLDGFLDAATRLMSQGGTQG